MKRVLEKVPVLIQKAEENIINSPKSYTEDLVSHKCNEKGN